MEQNNKIKVYTSNLSGNLEISVSGMKQAIEATNNRAKYFSEQSLKYRDEAKKYAEDARYYAEQNSDVSLDDLLNLKSELQKEINKKQDVGNYALKEELPINVSELLNDAKYTNETQLLKAVPVQDNNVGKVLYTNGEETSWVGINAFQLFDTKLSDRVLTYEESKGWALQGTYVYKEALAGSYYGYPDFYNKVVEEYNEATSTETVNGVEIKVHSNGHRFYDIANKDAIDSFLNTMGSAWFYGVDTENERVFLPRNNYFEQASSTDVGQSIQAGLPDHQHAPLYLEGSNWDVGDTADRFITNWNDYNGLREAATSRTGNVSNNPIYGKSDTVQPNAVKKLLYICVGNTTNYEGMTEVVNQGMEILEQVNQGIESRIKLDGSNAEFPYIVDIYVNGTSGYNVWKTPLGYYCEQWGFVTDSTATITLLKAYKDANYNILLTSNANSGTANINCCILSKGTTSFVANYDRCNGGYWKTCGYLAEGEY